MTDISDHKVMSRKDVVGLQALFDRLKSIKESSCVHYLSYVENDQDARVVEGTILKSVKEWLGE